MRIKYEMISAEISKQHNLGQMENNGWVYMGIQKGIYRLPQARILVNQQLTSYLFTAGYTSVRIIPGLWKHTYRHLLFPVCR